MHRRLLNPLLCTLIVLFAACTPARQPGPQPGPQPERPAAPDSNATNLEALAERYRQRWLVPGVFSEKLEELKELRSQGQVEVFGKIVDGPRIYPPPQLSADTAPLIEYRLISFHIEVQSIVGNREGTRVVQEKAAGSSRGKVRYEDTNITVGDVVPVYFRLKLPQPGAEAAFDPAETLTRGDFFWGTFSGLVRAFDDLYLGADGHPVVWTKGFSARLMAQSPR